MPTYDFEASLGYWIASANQAYMKALQELLRPHAITYRQAQVLGWLNLEGPLAQADLAARLLVEPPTLVGVLDRMEQSGYVERKPCPADRRRKMIHLSPAAEEPWQKISQCAKRLRRQASKGLSQEELQTLKQLLQKVQRNVGG